jgi:branched-chain amino acid transport system permease protein
MATFVQQLINGFTLGCVYALIALGYTLIFGVMRLIFFAQGELCMVGAFAAVISVSLLKRYVDIPALGLLAIALLAAVSFSVLIGVLAERIAIKPLRRAARTKQLIGSLGVSLILQNAVLLGLGAQTFSFPSVLPEDSWMLLGVRVSAVQILVMLLSLLSMLGLYWFLRHSRIGLHVRAVSESSEIAELDGINVDRTILATFILGSILAGLAGVMMGSYDGVAKYNMGFLPGIKGFTAAILGGFGNPLGAMIGGLVLGLAETLAAGYISSTYKDLIAFMLLVLILIVRPTGMFAAR